MKDFPSALVNVAESDFGPLLTAVSMLNEKYATHPVCAVAIERKIAADGDKLSDENTIVCNIHYQDPVVLFSLGQVHGMVVTKTKS